MLFHQVDRITWLIQSLLPDIWAVLRFGCYEQRAEHSRTSHAEDPRFLLLDTHLGVEFVGVRVDMCSTLVISYKLFPNHLCHSTPTPSDAHEPHLSTELNVLSLSRLDLVSTLRPPPTVLWRRSTQQRQGAQPRSLGRARLAPSDIVHARTASLFLLQQPEGNV